MKKSVVGLFAIAMAVSTGTWATRAACGQTYRYFSQKNYPGRYLGYVDKNDFVTCNGNRINLAQYKDVLLTPTNVRCASYEVDSVSPDAADQDSDARDKELADIKKRPKVTVQPGPGDQRKP